MPAAPIAIAHARLRIFAASAPTPTFAPCGGRSRLRSCDRGGLLNCTLSILLPIPATFAATLAPAAVTAPIALPDVGLTVADCIRIAIAFATTPVVDPSAMLFGPAYRTVGSIIAAAIVIVTPTVMSAAAAVVFAVPFVTLPAPVAAVVVIHVIATAAPVENVEAIAGIPVILIPAAAIADIVEPAAIVAVIIAVERAVWIAVIAIIIIAVAIVIIAKANAAIIIAGRKP